MIEIRTEAEGCRVTIQVTPRSPRTEIVGEKAGALHVRVSSPPEEGQANASLVRVLAKAVGVSRSAVQIVSGERSRRKIVFIRGLQGQEFLDRLGLTDP